MKNNHTMKKTIIVTAFVFVAIIASAVWTSCKKEEVKGKIYGTVTDYATGEPVGNVNVKLKPSGETTLTGSDGTYEFSELDAGKYSLSLSKAEYADVDDDYIIELEAGKEVKRDLQIRKRIASLRIADMEGNPLDTLDFGSDESVFLKSFNIHNDGTETLNCTAEYECDWIDRVSGLDEPVQPNKTAPVSVRIKRELLVDGANKTFLYITSGNGSNGIVIKATSLETTAITTGDPTDITSTSAKLSGTITDDGGRPVLSRGICYSTSQEPTLDENFTSDGSGTGTFSHNVTGLSASTTYYARAYATNRNGTVYAPNIVSFTTTNGLPTVTTTDVSNITATTAKSGGNITNNGGYQITAKGVCWNTLGSPDLDDPHTTNGNGNDSFVSNLTNLSVGTTYHVRAYATNQQGTAYGQEVTFTTLNGNATITISTPSNVTSSTATCSANITNDGGAEITERGFCWATSQYPTITNTHASVGLGTGSFSTSLINLSLSTTYYVRAYATNSICTSYSNQISFTTTNGLPTVTINNISGITATSATCGGVISSDGGFSVTDKGLVWSTAQYPTLNDNHLSLGSGATSFTGSMTNLSMNTTYYVRAYATNSNGTAYSDQQTFTTTDGKPIVTTITPSRNDITVTSGGNVTSDGGYTVTARGICYGTAPYPDITSSHSHTENGSGTGSYSSVFNLLGQGTYYIRAYATNANGTSYGNQVTVNHPYDDLPTFTYNGHTYRVAPYADDMSWDDANNYCESLELYGYSDWRLPTVHELYTMCAFGIFSSSVRHWSSTQCTDGHYSTHASSCNDACYEDYRLYSVLPVRVEN